MFYHLGCILMLSAALEDPNPWHKDVLNSPNVSLIQSICHLLVEQEVLLLQKHVLALLITEGSWLSMKIAKCVSICDLLLHQSESYSL